jgi:hypothetical protein
MESTFCKADEHYRKIEGGSQTEPIVIMEELAERLAESGVNPRSALCIALAQKHITRAGMKSGDSYTKDINKAINYLHRAVYGEWL